MIWKGVMPAITTCFDEALQIDHGFAGRTLPVAAGQWLQRQSWCWVLWAKARLSHSRKESQIVRTAVKAAHGRGPVVGFDFRALHRRGRGPGQSRRRCRMRRAHGAAALRLSGRLARDEGPRVRCVRSHPAIVHALQQPGGLRHRFSSRADSGTGGGAGKSGAQ